MQETVRGLQESDTEIAERNEQDIISYFPLKGPLTSL